MKVIVARVVIQTALLGALVSAALPAAAQSTESESARRPRFLLEVASANTSPSKRTPVDLGRSPSLRRPVTLDLDGAPFRSAIAELSRQSGMAIVFSDDVVASDTRVDLHVRGLSVAAALTEILLDKGLDVVMRPDGSAALVPRPPAPPPPVVGTVTGRVTDGATGAPLVAATVSLEGTNLGATTREDGTYRIAQVTAGVRTLLARRVGYAPTRRTVTVSDNQDATLDFPLTAAPMSLEGVVTTATGQQRRVELGNTIAAIEVADRKESSAITSMGDLIKAQATGVTVTTANVMGTAPTIRIRGISSRALSNDPIWVIDGTRMTSDVSGFGTGGNHTSVPSRINDIDPDEIESIEIVKGPSAATLYGTDAANGVIVVTTKRGKAGPARWSYHLESGREQDVNAYPDMYGIVGHAPGLANTTANQKRCLTTDIYATSTAPTCDKADLVQYNQNVLKDPDLTPLKTGLRTSFGGQISGGTNNLRYFISADGITDNGPYGLPNFDRNRFDTTGVKIRDNMEHPNHLDQKSLRANMNVAISPTLDVSVLSGLTLSDLTLPGQGNGTSPWMQAYMFGYGYKVGPGYTGLSATGIPLNGYFNSTPGISSQAFLDQTVNRFIGTTTANWRPLSWFTGSGDIGIDLTDQRDFDLERFGEGTGAVVFGSTGNVFDTRVRHINFSTNLRGTATWNPRAGTQLRSTGGWQFVSTDHITAQARGSGLGPGAETPQQATTRDATASNAPNKKLGMYVEEQLALRDRLFLTGAVRTDQASAFGTKYQNAYYPKTSVSWLASDESFFPHVRGLSQLRLRGSYGTSGVQPTLTAAQTLYSSGPANASGVTGTALTLSSTGNPDLKPERSSEFEAGFDSRWLNDRVNGEFTWYIKRTKDALFSQPVAPSAGVPSFQTNIGGMQNAGIEYRLGAQLIDRPSLGFDVAFSGSNNHNKITSLGPVPLSSPFQANQPGLPYQSQFKRKYIYRDANNDGYLSSTEVTVFPTDSTYYLGPSLAPIQMTLTAGAEFLHRRLRVQALVDRRAGGYLGDLQADGFECILGPPVKGCRGLNYLGASLNDQARAIALRFYNSPGAFTESTDFVKLREISASWDLGDAFAHRYLRAQSARVGIAGRNLHQWLHGWSGFDPEGLQSAGADITASENFALGAPRYYMVRLNVTY
jgi:TonB-linked SusC/RagA family outer membrane protein